MPIRLLSMQVFRRVHRLWWWRPGPRRTHQRQTQRRTLLCTRVTGIHSRNQRSGPKDSVRRCGQSRLDRDLLRRCAHPHGRRLPGTESGARLVVTDLRQLSEKERSTMSCDRSIQAGKRASKGNTRSVNSRRAPESSWEYSRHNTTRAHQARDPSHSPPDCACTPMRSSDSSDSR